jgi:hypothetical protein
VHVQELVKPLTAVCHVLKEVELLLVAVCDDRQSIEQQALFELNVVNCAAIDFVLAQPKEAFGDECQMVIADL